MDTPSIILVPHQDISISFEKELIQKVADYVQRGLEGSDNTQRDFYDSCKCFCIIFVIFFSSRNTGKNTMD